MSVLQALRRATAAQHEALEADLAVIERLQSPAEARTLLSAFYRLYGAAEPALAAELAEIQGLEFEARRKAPALAADLAALGVEAAAVGPSARPRLDGRTYAMGFAYVLEGATLGGRVIEKRLEALGAPAAGLSFFGFYGEATGPRWRSFCEILERECAEAPGQAVAGGRAGFDFMAEGLLADRTAPCRASA